MNVMIVFQSIEGQTAKIARAVGAQATEAGHGVRVVNLAGSDEPPPIDEADAVILAASVHERRHPEVFEIYITAHRKELEARKTLLLSVSLKAAFPEGEEEAGDYLTELKMRTLFEPSAEALVAGAVRSGAYDYFQSEVLRHVVLREHAYDPNEGPHEFTDWDALDRLVGDFLSPAVEAKAG